LKTCAPKQLHRSPHRPVRRQAGRLLERLDLKGQIVTGDAIFCQKSITAKIAEGGGDYVSPVKDNQKSLKENIETAFKEPVFPPVWLR
jgi:predicted transposase YbfD/YdcC